MADKQDFAIIRRQSVTAQSVWREGLRRNSD